jgi:hypothetical protein
MSASICTSDWQSRFHAVLPTVQTNAQIQFRRLLAEQQWLVFQGEEQAAA